MVYLTGLAPRHRRHIASEATEAPSSRSQASTSLSPTRSCTQPATPQPLQPWSGQRQTRLDATTRRPWVRMRPRTPSRSRCGRWGSRTPPLRVAEPRFPRSPAGCRHESSQCVIWRHRSDSERRLLIRGDFVRASQVADGSVRFLSRPVELAAFDFGAGTFRFSGPDGADPSAAADSSGCGSIGVAASGRAEVRVDEPGELSAVVLWVDYVAGCAAAHCAESQPSHFFLRTRQVRVGGHSLLPLPQYPGRGLSVRVAALQVRG